MKNKPYFAQTRFAGQALGSHSSAHPQNKLAKACLPPPSRAYWASTFLTAFAPTVLTTTLVTLSFALHAQTLEQTVPPVTNEADIGRVVNQVLVSNSFTMAQCMRGVANNTIMPCPQDCMIPVRTNGLDSTHFCNSVVSSTWVCEWPKSWVPRSLTCQQIATITGAGTGWSGGPFAVQQQVELRDCSTNVVALNNLRVPSGNPCAQNLPQYRVDPCPSGLDGSGMRYVRNETYTMNTQGQRNPSSTIGAWTLEANNCWSPPPPPPPEPPPPPPWWGDGGWGGGFDGWGGDGFGGGSDGDGDGDGDGN